MVRKLSQAVIDRLIKKYKKRMGAKVGDSKQFAKAIAGGTKIPTYIFPVTSSSKRQHHHHHKFMKSSPLPTEVVL